MLIKGGSDDHSREATASTCIQKRLARRSLALTLVCSASGSQQKLTLASPAALLAFLFPLEGSRKGMESKTLWPLRWFHLWKPWHR